MVRQKNGSKSRKKPPDINKITKFAFSYKGKAKNYGHLSNEKGHGAVVAVRESKEV